MIEGNEGIVARLLLIVLSLLVLGLMYLTFKPGDPASRTPNVQIGHFKGARFSKRHIFWFYAILIGGFCLTLFTDGSKAVDSLAYLLGADR